ncbi:PREDICTED: uncharacterized protein LOC107195062 [Dufourea novaeangliae]|uniref:uncharacterized protein LOC107195062 n=1 Tax=Dufourea novaeangliae TaxID=178035 RepID=UPI0007676354|nr:PREDICTED: uncharacterized protein LOC107195062 [Dufourea novaeangliae]
MDLKRNSVIAAYLAGKSVPTIVRELQHLNVNKMFAHRTINRYNDTGSVKKRYGGGRKKTATNAEIVRKVKKRIERNPKRSANKMAKELNVSRWSIQQILKTELQLKPYKIQKVHDLNAAQMKVRLDRAKVLKRLAASGEIPNIVFSDEKIFTIHE